MGSIYFKSKTYNRFLVTLVLVSIVIIFILISYQHQSNLENLKYQRKVVEVASTSELTTKEYVRDITKPNITELQFKPCKRKAVVIFAGFRTGSSFFGEYFNQHPAVYYLFEPLLGDENDRIKLLKNILKCNYSEVEKIYGKRSNEAEWVKCKSNVCFSGRSSFLWRNTNLCKNKHPFCGVDVLDINVLSKVCRQSIAIAFKVVRLYHLSDLEEFLLDPELDLKVLHLFRDPRPAVPSRIKMSGNNKSGSKISNQTLKYKQSAEYLCRFYDRNLLYVKNCIKRHNSSNSNLSFACNSTISNAWKNSYLRLTHEYISERPFDALELVYKFVGINFDANVAEWISDHTSIAATNNTKHTEKNISGKFFGTSRDSKKVLNSWRLKEQFVDVEAIQKPCINAIKSLGYIPVVNETHLKDISFSLYNINNSVVGSFVRYPP
ncbi:carbohydrate sulfotransferase 1-like [Styela clava]